MAQQSPAPAGPEKVQEWDAASKERKLPEKVKQQPVQQKTLKRGYQKLPPAK